MSPFSHDHVLTKTRSRKLSRSLHQLLARYPLRKQYAWLLIIAVIGSFIWLYLDTVNKTTQSNRIGTLQTLASQESKDTVLSLTLNDGSNEK